LPGSERVAASALAHGMLRLPGSKWDSVGAPRLVVASALAHGVLQLPGSKVNNTTNKYGFAAGNY
ncbi:hypothetical protein PF005_g33119, partial [Phytophthora fragariae]